MEQTLLSVINYLNKYKQVTRLICNIGDQRYVVEDYTAFANGDFMSVGLLDALRNGKTLTTKQKWELESFTIEEEINGANELMRIVRDMSEEPCSNCSMSEYDLKIETNSKLEGEYEVDNELISDYEEKISQLKDELDIQMAIGDCRHNSKIEKIKESIKKYEGIIQDKLDTGNTSDDQANSNVTYNIHLHIDKLNSQKDVQQLSEMMIKQLRKMDSK